MSWPVYNQSHMFHSVRNNLFSQIPYIVYSLEKKRNIRLSEVCISKLLHTGPIFYLGLSLSGAGFSVTRFQKILAYQELGNNISKQMNHQSQYCLNEKGKKTLFKMLVDHKSF